MADMTERIVMTPMGKTARSTTLQVERRKVEVDAGAGGAQVHVGGGQHQGIIVNKTAHAEGVAEAPPQLQLEFRVFLVDGGTGKHTQESRSLGFWFQPPALTDRDYAMAAQDFFKDLVQPLDFPRDYVGFIKKVMKMMQRGYTSITKIQIELRQLDDTSAPPPSGEEKMREVSEEQVLAVIESAYPNPVTSSDIAKRMGSTDPAPSLQGATHEELNGKADHEADRQEEEEQKAQETGGRVAAFLKALEGKGLVKPLAPGCYTRVVHNETAVKVVRQMPTMTGGKQPTIAIITAHYCEKLAVDAMIEDQETYVRYTTIGESNIYTLGRIGCHRVVCTKLPQVSHDRSASIAAGSTTTRLLGTFQQVEHVLVVGVGGAVPHYTDYTKHVRLGDVVVASPPSPHAKHVYLYCQQAAPTAEGGHQFECKSWGPPDLTLQHIAARLAAQGEQAAPDAAPWLSYLAEAEARLSGQEMNFSRPPPASDRLYMSIGGSDVIQVTHPAPPDGVTDVRLPDTPRLHLGLIASGRCVVADDRLHADFAAQQNVLAFDQEMDAVIESVYGNRKDTYTIIRGCADYRDGSLNREWQPHAALAAAAFMKAVICNLDPSPLVT